MSKYEIFSLALKALEVGAVIYGVSLSNLKKNSRINRHQFKDYILEDSRRFKTGCPFSISKIIYTEIIATKSYLVNLYNLKIF